MKINSQCFGFAYKYRHTDYKGNLTRSLSNIYIEYVDTIEEISSVCSCSISIDNDRFVIGNGIGEIKLFSISNYEEPVNVIRCY
jgi:hypothetical protein